MSEDTSRLQRAKNLLSSSDQVDSLTEALATIADASADAELRKALQDSAVFERLLALFAENYCFESWQANPPPKSLLRSIGNLVADNDSNRALLASSETCLKGFFSSLCRYTPKQQTSELEDFTIKILFNLCNEFPHAQQQAFRSSIHVAVASYMARRTWSAADEPLLSISTDLLARLVDHKRDIRPKEDYDDLVSLVQDLHTVLALGLDPTMFLDVSDVICTYLQTDDGFALAAVREMHISLVWDCLLRAEKMRTRREQGGLETSLDDDDDDDDDEDEDAADEEKYYRQYINILVQSLADISSTPAFTEYYTPDDPLIRDLCKHSVPSADHTSRTSSIPSTACLILGNLATNDTNCIALASPSRVPIPELFEHLSSSMDTSFLNSAAGLLRHLAIPLENRETAFDRPRFLDCAAHLYTAISLEQVQVAGLQLIRQLLIGNVPNVEYVVSRGGGAGAGEQTTAAASAAATASLTTILELFATTTSTATKLEIARLTTTMLRSLQPASSPAAATTDTMPSFSSSSVNSSDSQTLLLHLLAQPILAPLLFAITARPDAGQKGGAALVAVQADAWLGLNLIVRVPGGDGARGIAAALTPSSSSSSFPSPRSPAVDQEGGREESALLLALERRVYGRHCAQQHPASAPRTNGRARITEVRDGDDDDDAAAEEAGEGQKDGQLSARGLTAAAAAATDSGVASSTVVMPPSEAEKMGMQGQPPKQEEEDTRPEWVRKRERENAVLLVHDLLMSGEVRDGHLKSRLETLLREGTEGLQL
ncbi:hypothetical protein MBLNU459_g3856t1 [Dothideomycetes sp. NU459]